MVLVWQISWIALAWAFGRRFAWVARAPMLDVLASMLTWLPWLAAFYARGWQGLGLCLAAQLLSLEAFSLVHGFAHRSTSGGAKIRHALDEVVGPVRNRVGLWVTLLILPAMWMIRLGQCTVYPLQVWGLGFPWYRHSDWVSLNRQKFQGLVGHDLIWCLYCEWVLSIYSLGAEMIRNNESWWCPIQFHDLEKCQRCVPDFPDIAKWVPPTGSLQEVKDDLLKRYCPKKTPRAWTGYRAPR